MRRAPAPLLLSALLKTLVSTPKPRIIAVNPPSFLHFTNFHALPPIPHPFRRVSTTALPSSASGDTESDSISALEDALESATTTESLLSAFNALSAALPPSSPRLAMASLKVGQHLDSLHDSSPDTVLSFAVRSLKILDALPDHPARRQPLPLAMSLHLAASASLNLNRFHDSLAFSTRALRILQRCRDTDAIIGQKSGIDIHPVEHAVRLLLANAKTALGRREEALVDLRRCLELKELILEPGSRELGNAYRDLAEAYVAALDFKQALPLCLKAVEAHESALGKNSVEVAHDRKLLGVVYTGLEEHDKALRENEASRIIFKGWGMGKVAAGAELDAANIMIAQGKHAEAVEVLKKVVEQAGKDSEERAVILISMAKALSSQEKSGEAKQCLRMACEILEKRERVLPERVVDAYVEISSSYEAINELNAALELLKKSLAMIERLPQQQHMEGSVSARIGWLLLLTGKVSEAVQYLENAAERMKESFGPNHFGVAYVYNNLGAAYMEMDRAQSAAQMFALAKDIMDVSLGPHHTDSIEACQSLANAYNAMGSYALALEFQKRAMDAWSSHGPSASNELKEATRLYEELKEKAVAALTGAVSDDRVTK